LLAGLDLMLRKFLTASYYVTVFGSRNTAYAIGYFTSYPWNLMRVS
jgi:hypothetical protein